MTNQQAIDVLTERISFLDGLIEKAFPPFKNKIMKERTATKRAIKALEIEKEEERRRIDKLREASGMY
jgi:hypothetical protein